MSSNKYLDVFLSLGLPKMHMRSRRSLLISTAGSATIFLLEQPRASESESTSFFIAEAFRMKERAVASGDQPYGAVIVKDGKIVGHGPSRVILDRNPAAHAELVALWDAQRQLGARIAGAVIYSTSPPCSACQAALAQASIARMVYGAAGTEGGKPRP